MPRCGHRSRAGHGLHFHATDTEPQAAAEWVVDLTGDAITWRRAHEKAAVVVRAPLTDLLLLIYKRRPPAARASRSSVTRTCSASGWSGSASVIIRPGAARSRTR